MMAAAALSMKLRLRVPAVNWLHSCIQNPPMAC
jgi:hypothetical protein